MLTEVNETPNWFLILSAFWVVFVDENYFVINSSKMKKRVGVENVQF